MKLVLKQDVAHVGNKGETVEVSNGYGINYLIPHGMALKADSPQGLAYASRFESVKEAKSAANDEIKSKLAKLTGEMFTLPVEANDSGKLFAALTASKVAEMVSALTGVEITDKNVSLPDGVIKDLGEHDVEFVVGKDKLGKSMLSVITTS
jgi:large subunit ribosomal protein L9